jgi:hypothetical protein
MQKAHRNQYDCYYCNGGHSYSPADIFEDIIANTDHFYHYLQ